jgi:orotate phosphoribosyltransferase
LFANPAAIEPFIGALVERLRPYAPAVVCGPRAGGALLAEHVARRLDAAFLFTSRVAEERHGMYTARYVLPAALLSPVDGIRIAIVDDVMSAGSALRGTFHELRGHGADIVAAGALMVLGDAGASFFRALHVPLEAVCTKSFDIWAPDACPLCKQGMPLEDASD